jgi:hypothetical protein
MIDRRVADSDDMSDSLRAENTVVEARIRGTSAHGARRISPDNGRAKKVAPSVARLTTTAAETRRLI